MTTVTTARRGRRGWLIAALGVAGAVLLGSILAVGAWGTVLGPGAVGSARTGSGSGVIQDHRSDHYGPMMGSDPRSGDATDRRSGGMGTMGGWGNS